jgi:hypothetical protein
MQTVKTLDKYYQDAISFPCDINEHVETLCKYASNCESAVELGTGQRCTASWGILKGLSRFFYEEIEKNGKMERKQKDPWLVSLDIGYSANTEIVAKVANDVGVDYRFIVGSDLEVPLDSIFLKDSRHKFATDLTFIDTWHNYGQLKRELARFAPRTRKYIIMHDTEIDGIRGESVRMNSDIEAESAKTGIPVHEAKLGLQLAIDEFLAQFPMWTMLEQLRNNNGLTVLKRDIF